MGNGLTLYDARNVSWEDTRGVVQYVVVFPHRVLICPRDGCWRHAARQSGDLNNTELYCCVPCAQLEGQSDLCDRSYSSHTSLCAWAGHRGLRKQISATADWHIVSRLVHKCMRHVHQLDHGRHRRVNNESELCRAKHDGSCAAPSTIRRE